MPTRLAIIKIGGSLLRDRRDLERAAAAVAQRRRGGDAVLVVVSALKGVTDLLEKSAREALDASLNGHRKEMLGSLRERHEEIARQLNDGALPRVRVPLGEVDNVVASIRQAGDISQTAYARLLSSGERLSVPLMAAAIRGAGHAACGVTSEEMGLKAIGPRVEGSCDVEASAAGFRRLRSLLEKQVVVLTGFYGLDSQGEVVLFGRGGSDDTAGAVAAGLEADRLELWKDVGGFMTADPRHVETARVVPELSFDEVAQLGKYGSGIVHHGSLEPLRGRPTEIRICGLGGEDCCGTRLTGNRLAGNRKGSEVKVAVLTGRRGQHPMVAAVGDGVASEEAISERMVGCLRRLGVSGLGEVRPAGHAGLSCEVSSKDLIPALNELHQYFFAASFDNIETLQKL